MNVAKGSPKRSVGTVVIWAIVFASPNLLESVTVRFNCERGGLLGLCRDGLSFEVFLMNVFVSHVNL
jgi:hypothetical protein